VKSAKKLLFCNVDFDTDLALVRSSRQQQSCLDARFYYLLCGDADDRIILDAAAPESYTSYLSGHGLVLPKECSDGEILSDYTAFPWGWSRSAVDRFLGYGVQVNHPPLESVRLVNSRRFCHEATKRHGLGVEGSTLCASVEEVHERIRTCRTFPLVIKPEHGNAGIGFIHMSSPGQSDDDRLNRLYSRPGVSAVVEPWVDRLADISCRLELDGTGLIAPVTHHRTLNNRAGVYYGNRLEPEDPAIERWKPLLDEGALIISRELQAAGYFGPAGLDWIVYRDARCGKEVIALVDINARQPMSFVAYGLRDRLAPGKHCLLLFAPRRGYPALTDYASWYRHCGEKAFDSESATGILVFTPFSYVAGTVEYRPLRHGFFIAGNTGQEMLEYEHHLRNAFRLDR
jgi:hypothetical protein